MSSPRRRLERQMERELEEQREAAERARKDALSMWERIEEVRTVEDVKEILHLLTAMLGAE